jgi:hypothetical protein
MAYHIHKLRLHFFLFVGGDVNGFQFFGDDVLVIE